MEAPVTIVLLGAGNVATQLGKALQKSRHVIKGVWSPSQSAFRLASELNCPVFSDISEAPSAELYILAVKDDAIEAVAQRLRPGKGLVVHTAGSVGMQVLSHFENHGVLYPLQTLSMQKELSFEKIPLCVEASGPAAEELLVRVCRSLSGTVLTIDSEKRLALHVAAVFANNFAFYMSTVAADILNSRSLSFDLLKPLLEETFEKLHRADPSLLKTLQTGPARRNDTSTLHRHLDYLSHHHPDYAELYRLLSNCIKQS
jgi:predicted short-subunit dehydrogenase-like oxidoreductase (DUF2520 family)